MERFSTNVYAAQPEFEPVPLIQEVVIDGLAALRIIKHCNENSPTMVAGSLLGLDINKTLEVTYSFAFPQPKSANDSSTNDVTGVSGDNIDDLDGGEYQIEMMKMLRDVNIDNNCVGWYQSMYMGTVCTNDVVNYQHSYQSSEELSENSIVIMYDPFLSKKGEIILKAFRLSSKFMELKKSKQNHFIRPQDILEELPLRIKNSSHISAFLHTLQDTHTTELESNEFECLNLNNHENILEKHTELMTTWMNDLLNEQQRFQQYSRSTSKGRQEQIRWLSKRIQENREAREMGEYDEITSTRLEDSGLKALPEAPTRNDHLLMVAQLTKYSQHVNEHIGTALQTLTLTNQLNSAPN
jgi:translation initiation factor 3 subunit H